MALELVPFSEDHLDDASGLLAEVHARHRDVEPLLPGEVDYRAQVAAELAREDASGVAAVRDGRLVGYLVGAPASNDNRGGRRIFSDLAGHATAEPELARDLFAGAAERWHEEGHTRFAVVAPAHDADVVDAWFRVGFGLQFAYAVRESEAIPTVAGVSVRPATRDDLTHLARFDRQLWVHQVGSPSFSGQDVEPLDAFEAEWAEDTFDSPDALWPFVAERDGDVVGAVLLYRRPTGDLRVPDGNVDLALAATDPTVRGSGVGLAIAAHVLSWAHEHGFRSVTADWRSVNLLASRFWTRRGWRPTHLRLYRAIP